METSINSARRQPEVRAALKAQQMARLALKKKVSDGVADTAAYSAAYANQPEQIQKRKAQEAQAAARQAARHAQIAGDLAKAEGAAQAFNAGGDA